jgi:hypothetical protein
VETEFTNILNNVTTGTIFWATAVHRVKWIAVAGFVLDFQATVPIVEMERYKLEKLAMKERHIAVDV